MSSILLFDLNGMAGEKIGERQEGVPLHIMTPGSKLDPYLTAIIGEIKNRCQEVSPILLELRTLLSVADLKFESVVNFILAHWHDDLTEVGADYIGDYVARLPEDQRYLSREAVGKALAFIINDYQDAGRKALLGVGGEELWEAVRRSLLSQSRWRLLLKCATGVDFSDVRLEMLAEGRRDNPKALQSAADAVIMQMVDVGFAGDLVFSAEADGQYGGLDQNTMLAAFFRGWRVLPNFNCGRAVTINVGPNCSLDGALRFPKRPADFGSAGLRRLTINCLQPGYPVTSLSDNPLLQPGLEYLSLRGFALLARDTADFVQGLPESLEGLVLGRRAFESPLFLELVSKWDNGGLPNLVELSLPGLRWPDINVDMSNEEFAASQMALRLNELGGLTIT